MQQEMEYIYTVYQEGSISKAAEKLYMTQPALSMAIRRVESELNAILFDRSQHPLKLTNVGELYIQKYHEIKLLERELSNQINDIHQLEQGELTIGGTHFNISYVIAPVLAEFTRLYPNINIRLLECGSDQLDSMLLTGKIDLCLKCDSYDKSLKPIDYAFRDHLLMAVPKGYVEQYGLPDTGLSREMVMKDVYLKTDYPSLDVRYLLELPYLVLKKGNNLHQRFYDLFKEIGAEPHIQMQLEQFVTAYHLADTGIGATLTSAIIVKKSIGTNLVFYKVNSLLMTRDFYVIGRNKRYLPNTNIKFIEMLKSYYA